MAKQKTSYEIALEFDNRRAEIVKEIIKAETIHDMRHVVIWTRRFLDAFPAGKLAPIEKAVKARFEQKLLDAKYHLKGTCPACGDHMSLSACPDGIMRPLCVTCGKTYTPMGYDSDDDYALKWYAITWNGGDEPGEVIEVH